MLCLHLPDIHMYSAGLVYKMESYSERSEQKKYENRKKRIRRIKKVLIFSGGIAIVLGVLFYVLFQMNRTYDGYSVASAVKRADSSSAQYILYNEKLLKYSKDGASSMKLNGEKIWDSSYDMKNPFAVTCGNYVAIADLGDKSAYVFNGKDNGTQISMPGNIEQIAVGKQGVIATILEDNDISKINIYNPYDTTEQLKVSISTSADADGYPVAIALSEDAQKLVTSYINITGGVVESSLNFYNFDSDRKSNTDRIVGSRPLKQDIVADIQFLDNNTVCAFTEKGFYLYSMQETPKDIANVVLDQKIESVCYNSKYITLITENGDNTEKPYKLLVYNTKGKNILTKEISYKFDKVEMGEDEVILYSTTTCHIVRLRGSEKLDCQFETGVSYFFPIAGSNKYIIIDNDEIKQIHLNGRREGK